MQATAIQALLNEQTPADQSADGPAEIELARILAVDDQGMATIGFAAAQIAGTQRAMSTGHLAPDSVGRLAAIMFIQGDRRRPLIIGLLPAHLSVPLGPSSSPHTVIEAQEALVLQCGESSLTLQRDGRVVVRGKNIVSYASSTNRIRGAVVQLN